MPSSLGSRLISAGRQAFHNHNYQGGIVNLGKSSILGNEQLLSNMIDCKATQTLR